MSYHDGQEVEDNDHIVPGVQASIPQDGSDPLLALQLLPLHLWSDACLCQSPPRCVVAPGYWCKLTLEWLCTQGVSHRWALVLQPVHYGLTGGPVPSQRYSVLRAVSLLDCRQNKKIHILSLQNSRVGLENSLRANSCASTFF